MSKLYHPMHRQGNGFGTQVPRYTTISASSFSQRIMEPAALLLIPLHVALGFILKGSIAAVVAVGFTVLLIGFVSALLGPRRGILPVCCAGYLVGFEQVYRAVPGSDDILHWEFAKYSVILILGVMILRRPRGEKLPLAPLLYLLFLLPSTFLALISGMEHLDPLRARRLITGTLSGPFALGVSALYFSGCRLDRKRLRTLVLIMLSSIVIIATFSALNIVTLGDSIIFSHNSNRSASGGGGPNQVSNTLAIGVILCWLMILQPGLKTSKRLVFSVLLLILAVPMIFTFSRGGVFTTIIVIFGTLLLSIQARLLRMRSLLLAVIIIMVFYFAIFPFIDQYTSGNASLRYSSMKSDRWMLVIGEINVWLDHPFFGVGPGMARYEVKSYLGKVFFAHVEFSRALAEHGVFGLLALIAFFWGFLSRYRLARSYESKIWIVAAMLYTCCYWMQCATRTVGQGFVYGLVFLTITSYGHYLRPSSRSGRALSMKLQNNV